MAGSTQGAEAVASGRAKATPVALDAEACPGTAPTDSFFASSEAEAEPAPSASEGTSSKGAASKASHAVT